MHAVVNLQTGNQTENWIVLFLKMLRLINEERVSIFDMLESGISYNQVARRFNITISAKMRFVQCVNVPGSVSDRPRPC